MRSLHLLLPLSLLTGLVLVSAGNAQTVSGVQSYSSEARNVGVWYYFEVGSFTPEAFSHSFGIEYLWKQGAIHAYQDLSFIGAVGIGKQFANDYGRSIYDSGMRQYRTIDNIANYFHSYDLSLGLQLSSADTAAGSSLKLISQIGVTASLVTDYVRVSNSGSVEFSAENRVLPAVFLTAGAEYRILQSTWFMLKVTPSYYFFRSNPLPASEPEMKRLNYKLGTGIEFFL